MKYKTRITAHGDGYIGHAFLNEESVYTTNTHKDTIMVARELSGYIANASAKPSLPSGIPVPQRSQTQPALPTNLVPLRRNLNSSASATFQTAPSPAEPAPTGARKCCGRG
jgi:hypothetical protein